MSEGIIWETSISTAFESARNEKKLIFIRYNEDRAKHTISRAKMLSNFSRLTLNYGGYNYLSFVKEVRSIRDSIKESCFTSVSTYYR